jgi:glucosyl-3-phosphoglycerate synthase
MSATTAERWAKDRSFHHSLYPPERIAAAREQSVSVCLPARECGQTVGEIVTELLALREAGAIDEVVVVDAASGDGTAEVAERAGAVVWQEAELLPDYGPVLGKGDAMWRALSALGGELVCFLDADTEGFSAHFATGLLGPLVCEPGVAFVKGFYRRPLGQGGGSDAQPPAGRGAQPESRIARPGSPVAQPVSPLARPGSPVAQPDGGGRVNHLMARPALELFYPELAGVRQPLAGEVAARRELLESVPFATGYGVEIAMLIDVWRLLGLEGMAQVDLEEHRNRHQPLSALVPMARTVLATIAGRLEREGRLEGVEGAPVERPPVASVEGARVERPPVRTA